MYRRHQEVTAHVCPTYCAHRPWGPGADGWRGEELGLGLGLRLRTGAPPRASAEGAGNGLNWLLSARGCALRVRSLRTVHWGSTFAPSFRPILALRAWWPRPWAPECESVRGAASPFQCFPHSLAPAAQIPDTSARTTFFEGAQSHVRCFPEDGVQVKVAARNGSRWWSRCWFRQVELGVSRYSAGPHPVPVYSRGPGNPQLRSAGRCAAAAHQSRPTRCPDIWPALANQNPWPTST